MVLVVAGVVEVASCCDWDDGCAWTVVDEDGEIVAEDVDQGRVGVDWDCGSPLCGRCCCC